jgi:ubiquinone/menaquinone biosynthesis C-methylase UbiE
VGSCRYWWLEAGLVIALVVLLVIWLRRRVDQETIQRRFWDPTYDRLARLYDGVDWFTGGTTHRFRLRALPYLPPEGVRVLEIGFGSGRLHLELAGRYEMAGLDRARGMVSLTRRRLKAHGLTSDVREGSVEAIPWPNGHFDAVVTTFAFSAFPDAGAAMDEMVRVVKPGGKVIIVDAGEASDGNAIARFLARLWEALGDYMRDEAPLMAARGLTVEREEFGPWRCIHAIVGTKP